MLCGNGALHNAHGTMDMQYHFRKHMTLHKKQSQAAFKSVEHRTGTLGTNTFSFSRGPVNRSSMKFLICTAGMLICKLQSNYALHMSSRYTRVMLI